MMTKKYQMETGETEKGMINRVNRQMVIIRPENKTKNK